MAECARVGENPAPELWVYFRALLMAIAYKANCAWPRDSEKAAEVFSRALKEAVLIKNVSERSIGEMNKVLSLYWVPTDVRESPFAESIFQAIWTNVYWPFSDTSGRYVSDICYIRRAILQKGKKAFLGFDIEMQGAINAFARQIPAATKEVLRGER
jgi:hypothetical protein